MRLTKGFDGPRQFAMAGGAGGGGTAEPPPAPAGTPPPPAGGEPPAGGTPPATPPATPPGGGGEFQFSSLLGDDGNFVDGFTRNLPPELQSDWKNLDRYKSPMDLMKGTVEMAKLVGKKTNGIEWPDSDADEATIAEFHEKMGIPQEYDLKRPEELPEQLKDTWGESDDATLAEFGKLAKQINLRPEQVEQLTAWHLQQQAGAATAMGAQAEAAEQQHLSAEIEKFRSYHGDKTHEVLKQTFDQTLALLQNPEVMGNHVLSTDDAHTLLNEDAGFKSAGVLQVLSAVLKGTGQAKFIDGAPADSGKLEQIEAELKKLTDGPKLSQGDPQTLADYNRLNKAKHAIMQRNGEI